MAYLTLEGENGDSALGVSSPDNSEVPICKNKEEIRDIKTTHYDN
jgi:hypothetical protein